MEQIAEQVTLTLEGEGLSDNAIRGHEIALRRMIRENVRDSEVLEAPAAEKAGTKGEPITMGIIVLTLIKSGAVLALINCIKAIVVREKKLKLKLQTKDGKTIELDAQNIDSQSLKDQLEALTRP